MAHVEFLDETMRDGQQSLWGMRMQAGMALPVAPTVDRTGYRTIDLTGSSMFECLIKYCYEDPWEGLDLLVAAMPRTRIRAGMRSNASVTFGVTPDSLMDAWMRQLNEHGCRSYWIYDVLFNNDKTKRLAKLAKEYDSEIAGAIMFTLSPVHTDEYYAKQADELSESDDIDTILLYDTAGVLEKERLSTLVPAIKAKARGKPIEFHSNNLLGQSAKAYLDAIDLGVSILHTAVRPMANGPSVPSVEIMSRNVELLGHTHDLDTSLFAPVADHFEKVGKAAGFLVNQYAEYDVMSIEHQVPGGMVGTLKAQLVQHGMSERLDDVLAETAVVRRELGYPGMATPFSQLVGTQAVLNIITGKRYSSIPDEVIQYAAGFYGEPAGPVDPNIMDQIMSSPRAKEVVANPPPQPSIEALRKEYGVDNDDDLILNALVAGEGLDRMRQSGPVRQTYPYLSSPELDHVSRLMQVATSPVVQIKSAEFELSLRKSS
ncbi:MAG: pyruvate carboxylase [Gammaproteobacteria bacterium]